MTIIDDGPGEDHLPIGGLLLLLAAIAAIVMVNSGLAWLYIDVLQLPLTVALGTAKLEKPLQLWINDGLMAIFFLLVGLEIKREILSGSLKGWKKAILPCIGAVGGFIAPALIFTSWNWHEPTNFAGWAIPSATDIAFAVAVASLLGRSVPTSLKVFLLALATLDDLLAIGVIAVFYTSELSGIALGLATLGLTGLWLLNHWHYEEATPYVLVGLFTWACVLESGVHATLAGVAVGMAMPLSTARRDTPLLLRAEHALSPWVTYIILPLFAFANAGVPISQIPAEWYATPLSLGIIFGLVAGKPFGVLGSCWLARHYGVAEWPFGISTRQFLGIACLAGIGFTMSLFIGSLAFRSASDLNLVRAAVLTASTVSTTVAIVVLKARL